MPTRAVTDIKKRQYRILYRDAASVSTPADLAAMATLIGTFTELGYTENKTTKAQITQSEATTLDDGSRQPLGKNGNFETKMLQSGIADQATLEALDGTSKDIMLLPAKYASGAAGNCHILKAAKLNIEFDLTSGELEGVMVKAEWEDVETISDIKHSFSIPTS